MKVLPLAKAAEDLRPLFHLLPLEDTLLRDHSLMEEGGPVDVFVKVLQHALQKRQANARHFLPVCRVRTQEAHFPLPHFTSQRLLQGVSGTQ